MAYKDAKVYFDGSHYIAIPHTTKNFVPRKPKSPEEQIIINEESTPARNTDVPSLPITDLETIEKETLFQDRSNLEKKPQNKRKITLKEFFEELYSKALELPRKQRKNTVIQGMKKYFKTEKDCIRYVELNFDRKLRNLICRRVRMTRKAFLATFNYFCTFTYSDILHSEKSFKKKLRTCLRNFSYRHNWVYMGIWERAPKTKRLHFHGLFFIPENTLPGEISEVKDFNTKTHSMQLTYQSTYFNRHFGRSDFKKIDEEDNLLNNALAYLMKYIEKTGERIVYSKGLPQFFVSDILDEDIVCTIGQEDKKLLLYDNFKCIYEGVVIGKVSKEVIKELRKVN